MSRRNQKVAYNSLHAMMCEMWYDVNNKGLDADIIIVSKYARKHRVGVFKRDLIIPYLHQNTMPTYEQACELRKKISEEINKNYVSKKTTLNLDAEELGLISKYIEYLRRKGYIVFKQM